MRSEKREDALSFLSPEGATRGYLARVSICRVLSWVKADGRRGRRALSDAALYHAALESLVPVARQALSRGQGSTHGPAASGKEGRRTEASSMSGRVMFGGDRLYGTAAMGLLARSCCNGRQKQDGRREGAMARKIA